MKKLLVSISLLCIMIISSAVAAMARIDIYGPVDYIEPKTNSSWGIVICFIAIVLVMLLIKIRINKKK